MGVLFAIIAMLFWGVGDFLIQKSTRQVGKIRIKSFFSCLKRRRFGNLVVLFYITFIGAVIISPFISKEIINFINDFDVYNWAMLGALSLVMLVGAIFDFKGLKMGKISVIEPVFAFEIPITALLAAAIIKESLNFGQTILIIALFVGIVLVTTRSFKIFSRGGWKLEKGVVYAMLGVVCFGSVNFLIGISAREMSPLFITWFYSVFIAFFVLIYLLFKSGPKILMESIKQDKTLILSMALIDNVAWIVFAYSMLYIPIAITTGISEGYIALAAGLGFVLNRERLRIYQIIGFVLIVISAVILAIITG